MRAGRLPKMMSFYCWDKSLFSADVSIPVINDGVSTIFSPAPDEGGWAGFALCAQGQLPIYHTHGKRGLPQSAHHLVFAIGFCNFAGIMTGKPLSMIQESEPDEQSVHSPHSIRDRHPVASPVDTADVCCHCTPSG